MSSVPFRSSFEDKSDFLEESEIKNPFECFALIDEKSTWRLDSLHNYVEAHRAIIASHLLKGKGNTSLNLIYCD